MAPSWQQERASKHNYVGVDFDITYSLAPFKRHDSKCRGRKPVTTKSSQCTLRSQGRPSDRVNNQYSILNHNHNLHETQNPKPRTHSWPIDNSKSPAEPTRKTHTETQKPPSRVTNPEPDFRTPQSSIQRPYPRQERRHPRYFRKSSSDFLTLYHAHPPNLNPNPFVTQMTREQTRTMPTQEKKERSYVLVRGENNVERLLLVVAAAHHVCLLEAGL